MKCRAPVAVVLADSFSFLLRNEEAAENTQESRRKISAEKSALIADAKGQFSAIMNNYCAALSCALEPFSAAFFGLKAKGARGGGGTKTTFFFISIIRTQQRKGGWRLARQMTPAMPGGGPPQKWQHCPPGAEPPDNNGVSATQMRPGLLGASVLLAL